MDAATIFLNRLEAYGQRLGEVMDDITDEDLSHQPGPDDNPIGWLMWHMTRFEDATIACIEGAPQVWVENSWHEHFGLPEAPGDTGAGHTIEQVRAFRATCETLTGYAAAVRERTIKCLSRLTPGDLDEVIDDFAHGSRLPTGDILARAFGDTVTHIGQICYIRGHLKGWGKYGR